LKPEHLSVDLPRIDADTQSRVAINEDTVADYAEVIANSDGEWPFPPLDVFHDGTDYYVADGFHRFLAAQRSKRGTFPCRIHKGTAKDARIFGMTANDTHGLRMSRADKRACVEWLLDGKAGMMTQVAIAEAAGVTPRTVRTIATDRKYPDSAPPKPNTPPKAGRKTSATPLGGVDSQPVDYGKCPNCSGQKWKVNDADGSVDCAKCRHPHGEPAGDVDEERVKTQRQKTVKTAESLMRAFDDLQCMKARAEHSGAITYCKALIKTAKAWK
jgi:uncharacterized ParB-like nuclease family protein